MLNQCGYRFDIDEEVIGIYFLALLKEVLEEEGHELRGYAGPESDLKNFKKRISLRRVLHCLGASLEGVEPGLGIRYGRRLSITSADTLGQLIMSSPTLGKAMEYVCRFRLLLAMSFDLEFDCSETLAVVRSRHFGSDMLPLSMQHFLAEALYTCFMEQARWLGAKTMYYQRLSFPYPKPAHVKQYHNLFGCELEFNASCHEVSFPREYLNVSIPTANRALETLKQQHCGAVLEKWQKRFCVIQQVNDILFQSYPDFPAIEQVAVQLEMSRSSLYRKLSERNTSYQCLINAFKRKQSINLLKDTCLSVEEVAEHLGFSDASSFRRAFKSWTGMQPSVVRAGGQARLQ